ncbi:hypothetical protein GCM10017559_62980 [Streptosporangium longisporum]|uniref:Uncharacterized protein n=1 Tax=Streptosporangium longisporum TaxID=46187 RepID=A0ABP6KZM8_9ACTN
MPGGESLMKAAYELSDLTIHREYEEIGSPLWYRVHCSVKVRPHRVNPGYPLPYAPNSRRDAAAVADDMRGLDLPRGPGTGNTFSARGPGRPAFNGE